MSHANCANQAFLHANNDGQHVHDDAARAGMNSASALNEQTERSSHIALSASAPTPSTVPASEFTFVLEVPGTPRENPSLSASDPPPTNQVKRPRGRPRKKPLEVKIKRPVGRPRKQPQQDDAPVVKRRPGRPSKKEAPTGTVVFKQVSGPITVAGTARSTGSANDMRAIHPLFRPTADGGAQSTALASSDMRNAPSTNSHIDVISPEDNRPAVQTIAVEDSTDNIDADDRDQDWESDEEEDEEDCGNGLGESDDADDTSDDSEDDNDGSNSSELDETDESDWSDADDDSAAQSQPTNKKHPRRPLPDWLMTRFRARLAELEKRDARGLPLLYAQDKTFWFPQSSPFFTLSDGQICPTAIYDVRFFAWDPKALVPDLPCPQCSRKLNRHSVIQRPRRVVDIDSTFYMIGFRYKCMHCVNPKTQKRTVTFRSWDPRILAVLPPSLAAEFPAHLTHRSAISHRLCTWMRACFSSGMEHKRFADALRAQHLLRYDELYLKYLNFIVSRCRSMEGFLNHKKYKTFPRFEDTSPEGFHGYVPSFSYLRDIYDEYIHRKMPIIAKMRAMQEAEVISVDHSFKIPKHIVKYHGQTVFSSLFACTTGTGANRLLDLVTSKSHAQMQLSLSGMRQSMKLYGLKGPYLAFTDNPADRALLESIFPSLREGVVPVDKYGRLPPYKLPSDVKILLLKDEGEINTAASSILNQVPLDGSPLVIGFDCEWNFSKSEYGQTDKGDIAVIQIAYQDYVLILQVSEFISRRRLPVCLLSLLSSPRIMKAGRAVHADLKQLQNLLRPSAPFVGAQELGTYAKSRRVTSRGNPSLADLCAAVFKTCLNKNEYGVRTCMDWESETLSDSQVHYAACDAYVALQLYHHLSTFTVPRLIRQTTPISTPVLVYHTDGTTVIAQGRLASRILNQNHTARGISLSSEQVIVEVIRVLVPGAVITSRPLRLLQDYGYPPFYLAAHRRHVTVVDGRIFSMSQYDEPAANDNSSTTNLPEPTNPLYDVTEEIQDPEDAGPSVADLLYQDVTQGANPAGNEGSLLLSRDADRNTISPASASSDPTLTHWAFKDLERPDPAFDNVLRTRVLKDIFHVFHMIRLSPSHGLAKDFARRLRDILLVPDVEDMARISSWAATLTPPQTFQQIEAAKPKWLWKHCRRVIRPPSIIFPLVEKLFLTYGPLKDAQTGHPLFAAHNWRTARHILDLIRQGYISDPPGFSLYTVVKFDRKAGNLPIYRCARGTNFTEGGIHTHLRSRLPTCGASLKHTNACLNDFNLHHNERANAFNTTGKSYRGHYEPWLTNSINERLLVLKNRRMLEKPPKLKGWINPNFYIDTNERIGIQPIPGELRRKYNMFEHGIRPKKKQRYSYLARMLKTRKAAMPVHTPLELATFHHLLENNPVFKSLPNPSSWNRAVQIWNEMADETDGLYYKTLEQLKAYYALYQRRLDVQQTLALASNARLAVIQDTLFDRSRAVEAPNPLPPPPLSEHPIPKSGLRGGAMGSTDVDGAGPLANDPVAADSFTSQAANQSTVAERQPSLAPNSDAALQSTFAVLAEHQVSTAFEGTTTSVFSSTPAARPPTDSTAPMSGTNPQAGVAVSRSDKARSARHCMRCGQVTELCKGSQNLKECHNPCQDCHKMGCRGRNSKRPTKRCWEGWEPTQRKKRKTS